jgi:hypothetical protein
MHTWHQSLPGLLTFFMLEAVLVYAFASLAIDRGSAWFYLLTLLFLIGSLQNLVKLIGKSVSIHGR